MVLQRERPITVFGSAAVGETIAVSFNGASASTIADNTGRWEVILSAMSFGGPYTMTVQGASNTISLSNVLIGDVYLCSGQSNMEFQLFGEASANSEIPLSTNNNIRFITVPKNFNTVPQTDIPKSSWLICNPSSSTNFSAVAYYFGKNIQNNLNIPIGLISSAWWATSIRSWMAWDNTTQVDVKYQQYVGKTIEQASGQTQAALQTTFQAAGATFAPSWPSIVYNSMISPFTKFGIKGVIWYQGEANAAEAVNYKTLFQALIVDWRKKWGYDFGFFWVQLPGYGTVSAVPQESQWAELRESQNSALSIPKTGQAVTTDLGDTILHPTNKKDVGYRLAQSALKLVYGQNNSSSGPLYNKYTIAGSSIILEFSNTGTGLLIKDNSGILNGFTIAGSNNIFYNATATIAGNKVTVSSASVTNPVAVRYAWADNPKSANLVNSSGLLASPFRTNVTPPAIATAYIKNNAQNIIEWGNANLCDGDSVSFGFYPILGSWSWKGPNNFTSTSREIKFQSVALNQAGSYVANYTNANGIVFSQTFNINVNAKPAISPFVQIAGGAWSQNANNIAVEGQSVKFSPLPRVVSGWSWTGPNGFTSTLREPTISVFSKLNEGIYTVIYTNSSGCSDSFSFNLTLKPTALNDLQNNFLNGVQIYPNPAHGFLFVNIKPIINEAKNIQIKIEALDGKEVVKLNYTVQSSDIISIDIKNLKTGLYFVTLSSENYRVMKKFIKVVE